MDIKEKTLVITSRGRYGIVLEIDDESYSETRCKVKIGNKEHWIFRSQLRKAEDTITLKVKYELNYIGKPIEDSIELVLPKKTVLFNKRSGIKFEDVIKFEIVKQLGTNVEIIEILIS